MESPSDKPHEPTARKLEKAREKGEVVRSNDVSVAASYAGLLVALALFGTLSVDRLGLVLAAVLDHANALALITFEGHPASALAPVFMGVATWLAAWFALPMLCVMAVLAAQRGILFTPSKLNFKASRINPIQNARQKYGRRGLFEFAKSFTKLAAFSVCLGLVLVDNREVVVGAIHASPAQGAAMLGRLGVEFLAYALAVAVVIAAADYLWQRQEFLRQNRMSHKDLKDEMKESEGDPHMKGVRRSKAQAIAMNQMMADVPKSDVVIVNPTHYAVALSWSREPGTAPTCLAKGKDEIAARIRALAMEHAVPVHSDPPTARALFAVVEVGDEIRPEHYRAVAAAIRFADTMRRKARPRS